MSEQLLRRVLLREVDKSVSCLCTVNHNAAGSTVAPLADHTESRPTRVRVLVVDVCALHMIGKTFYPSGYTP